MTIDLLGAGRRQSFRLAAALACGFVLCAATGHSRECVTVLSNLTVCNIEGEILYKPRETSEVGFRIPKRILDVDWTTKTEYNNVVMQGLVNRLNLRPLFETDAERGLYTLWWISPSSAITFSKEFFEEKGFARSGEKILGNSTFSVLRRHIKGTRPYSAYILEGSPVGIPATFIECQDGVPNCDYHFLLRGQADLSIILPQERIGDFAIILSQMLRLVRD